MALGPQFDELYRDFQPPCPMHKITYGAMRDPVHRHGAQALELRSLERKGNNHQQQYLICFVTIIIIIFDKILFPFYVVIVDLLVFL